MGIPTVIITREGFDGVVENAFSSKGFSMEAAHVVYPSNMFLPGSELDPLASSLDRLVAGITSWEPEVKRQTIFTPEHITVLGEDREDAAERINERFLQEMWADGLPIVPPTKERVEWMMTGTDLPPDAVIGEILPRGGIATVETLAVNLVMAGGRPEYMPVFLAAVEAIVNPKLRHQRMNTTTNSTYPVVIVNGPVAKQIPLNSGYGCLGPDPLHFAGASIGRAIRFVLMNVGGAMPGKTSMAIYGGPARYTGLVFAEDEAGIPADWSSLGEEQGYSRDRNVVTVYAVSGTTNIPGGETGTDKAVLASLNRAAGCMGIPVGNYWFMTYHPKGTAGILLMARGTAQGLSAGGWSKEAVKRYLWEHSKVPAAELGPRIEAWWMPDEDILQDPMPISMFPDGIRIVVAGGDQSGHMMWLQVGCCPEELTSAEVRLPKAWDELLKQAKGCLGACAAHPNSH